MEKTSAEDDCVDSGAETAGSDYSPLSSTSKDLLPTIVSVTGGEFSMGEFQDPFLVSVHLIADPGQGRFLQRAADGLLAWVHPELQLFRVSERASVSRPKHHQNHQNGPMAPSQPSMAVIVFLQEAYGGEEQILSLHRALQRPPWRYHHTEKVSNGRRMLPLTPCSQDFFTLSSGTPLWAVRQVHYGKEIVRFTVYCRHENYVDMGVAEEEDFCLFVVYSNPDMEIQLSFKRLPRGQSPLVMESAVMEVRVRDVGTLVPLLPQPCSPISEDPYYISSSVTESASAPSTFARSSYRNRRHHHHRSAPRPRAHQTPHPVACEEEHHPDSWRSQWRDQRSGSLFSLPNVGSASSRSACSSPGPSPSPHSLNRSSSLIPSFRLNLDALVGAEETDVDTGDQEGSHVVSAYIKSSLPQTRPLSAPPENIRPSLSPGISEDVYRAATLGRTPQSFTSKTTPYTMFGPCVYSPNTSASPSLSDVSINQSDSCSVISVPLQGADTIEEEDDQEFYI
ncbi:hypothetical protein F7725_002429 [Dissostichus mawsoni]|uniref:FAM124 domain-containing protein n=1 Tax=Dissostichus mawsoni TaxID=36200 RepID=A0A7J5Y2K4_DISMA|nr:hypothetical protein F7725_002429 [Dissostichus mawsoni]